VTLKWAMSLDGRIATASGESQWISSPAGRRWGLAQREEHDAILVGIETALADDPRLDRRLGLAGKDNVRVVLDRRLRLPCGARLFGARGEVLIYTQADDEMKRAALEARGAIVVRLNRVDPAAVLDDLYRKGIRSLLIEGGAGIAAAFAEAGLFDRVGVDLAPLLIGGRNALSPLGGAGSATLEAAPRLGGLAVERRGEDVILTGFRASCLPGLFASVAP
jgi:diaminohydroxyphosphoribosylaminopyrimidine deaminase/5-amino-6-(5-phosphoribosylamino)uracil reductase